MSNINPYDSPAPVANPAKTYTTGRRKIDFAEAFRFPFSNPNWPMNLLWGSLCFLLGSLVVPQIIFSGYQWEVLERMHRRKVALYDDFDTNRLGDYLMRGVWPFLTQMLLSVVLLFIIVPLVICGVGGMAVAGANDAPSLGFVFLAMMYLALLLLGMVFHVAIMPFLLRAGLAQDLGKAFNIGWAREFVGLMWKEMLLGALVLAVASICACMVGAALFCIGAVPALAVLLYANTHFVWQVYELFLERGGTPIPLKPEPVKFG